MRLDVASLTTRLRSGWVAALVSVVATVVFLLTNGIAAGEVVRFSAYCVLGLVLPGTVLWRLLVSRPGSTLVADTVFGTTLALAVELAVYACFAHVGHPGLAKLWPVIPLVLAVLPTWRGRIWRRAEAQPTWWSWSMSGLMVLALGVLKQSAWDIAPLTSAGLRNPYVDMPYHLSLVAGLSQHVKSDLLFVEGEPLYYHWFDHAHVAAERHATGIEPIILLSRLDMLIPVAIVLIGSAMIAQRVAKSPLAGLVATTVLTVGGTILVWPRFSPMFLVTSTYISPTTAFACAIIVGCIALTVEIVDLDVRPPPTVWIAAVLLIAASSGAKGTALPILLAGWISLLLMSLVLQRRVHWPALALTVIGVVVFLVAQKVIYGGSTQGTSLIPFGLGNYLAFDAGLLDKPAGGSLALRATLTVIYVSIRMSCLIAVIGLFRRSVWRNPHAHFLVGSMVGGLGAVLLLDSATRNQVYFVLVTPAFIAVITGWGLVELLRRVPTRVAARVCVGSLAAGALVSALLVWPLRPTDYDEDGGGVSLWQFVVQPLAVVLLLVLVALVLWVVGRGARRVAWRHTAPLACVSLVLGLGLLTGPLHALDVSERVPAVNLPTKNPISEIAPGGIDAALWLRDHSAEDDIVATNSHCRFPGAGRCDHRAFWISGYAERQMLVEGWSYTARSARLAAKEHVSVPYLSYWHHAVLEDNDLAFRSPTRQRLARLHRVHHVRWMFVDKRFRADLPGLTRLADLRYSSKYYAIFRLR